MTMTTEHNMLRGGRVLLVEDSRGDVILTQRAFREANTFSHIMVAESGEQALAMLRREAGYSDVKTPDIILLDLNLPKMSGHEVLYIIKTDENLKCIPVIIISSSCARSDVIKSYAFHANAYVIKPIDFERTRQLVVQLEQFWLALVKLPDMLRAGRTS